MFASASIRFWCFLQYLSRLQGQLELLPHSVPLEALSKGIDFRPLPSFQGNVTILSQSGTGASPGTMFRLLYFLPLHGQQPLS